MIRLNNFEDIVQFIREHKPRPNVTAEIMRNAFKVIIFDMPEGPEEQITLISEFYEGYKQGKNRVFYNININLRTDEEQKDHSPLD